ncbi:MAG: peptidoglycan-associated lipoprotein Pal [Syntrophales bacterium]|nr:peptidoglycan-associated lipoprotein Pal [Syntrophales bacterium]
MKRKWGLAMLALLVAVVFVSGCAGEKTVLQEEKAGAKESAIVGQQAGDVRPVGKEAKSAAEARPAAEAKSAEEARPAGEAKSAEEARLAGEARAAEKTEATAAPAKDVHEFADIHFDFDKFNLREEDRAILQKHADWLNGNRDVTITVEGHCDETGTAEYNLALGERRANAAARFLIDLGIDAKRIKTISYGKEAPLDPGHNEEAWAKNRRAHFVASAKK